MYTVYSYGIYRYPTSGWPEMRQQNFLRQVYWNKLVKIEHEYWDRQDAILLEASPTLQLLEAEHERVKLAREGVREQVVEWKKANHPGSLPPYLTEARREVGTEFKRVYTA